MMSEPLVLSSATHFLSYWKQSAFQMITLFGLSNVLPGMSHLPLCSQLSVDVVGLEELIQGFPGLGGV